MSEMIPINKVVESVSITHKFDLPILKFLNTSDVENGKIVNINLLPLAELKGQAKKTIKKHDILFSEIRPKNKRFAYVDVDDTYDYVVSTKLMVLRNINPDVDNKYFYYFLTNDNMLSILQDRAENRIGSFPQITFELLSEYSIRVPKLSEQQQIASVLSALDSKIELNNRINAELEAMAKTLYDYWFVQFDFPDENGKPYKTSGGKMVWNEELKRFE
jgi:type I restriction enzyme S subunit